MIRTHQAGSLRPEHVGTPVTLAGWVAKRRDLGGVAFLDLRDASGIVQVVVRDDILESSGAHSLRNEYCISVTGVVEQRSADTVNPNLATGEVEVAAGSLEVLNASAPLPFQLDERSSVNEDARLKYRYLDLRRQRMHDAMVLRSSVTHTIREVLGGLDFYDIETPTLTRSTPEGARDFVVPARLHPGAWYALPQSPQLFKQLLMVGGMERYYQIARCYRDEDFRADRQPEFTQLDIEMSFVDQDDVIAVAEKVMAACWALIGVEVPTPLPRMTWADAMDNYGSDKPDLRFDTKIRELTSFFADTPFRVFQAEYVGGVVMPGGGSQPRRTFDAWQEWARQRGAKGLAYVTIDENGELGGPVAKNISEAERAGLAAAMDAQPGDCIFFGAGRREATQELLGATRLEIARRCGLIDENAWSALWVYDFPLFAWDEDEKRWDAEHHPFCMPHPEDWEYLNTDPGKVRAMAYDLVINGVEMASGSIRIHRRDIQQKVFDIMGIDKETAEERFGFMLKAFEYGTPPHAGIAPGFDRLVMMMAGEDNIREVIAFPKTQKAQCLMSGAPSTVDMQALRDLHIKLNLPTQD